MPIYNRISLKNFFKNGNKPNEANFSDLIDSTINKIDDGFAKSTEDGLQLSPQGKSKRVMSIYEDSKDSHSSWCVAINPKEWAKGLAITGKDDRNLFFIKQSGAVGVGTLAPRARLDVYGASRSKARVGGYASGTVPADGNWHAILQNLTGCHTFEIVAKVAAGKGRGKYAMAHAIAINAYGSSSAKVKVTQSWYGSFWNKLKFRWRGDEMNYRLEVKTQSHYGLNKDKPFDIYFHACNLWDDAMFNHRNRNEPNT